MRPRLGFAFAVLIACGGTAHAFELTDQQIASLVSPTPAAPARTYEDILSLITRPIRAFDLDRDGLDKRDLERARQVREAEIRGSTLGGLLIFDLDNDQRVTREEIEVGRRSAAPIDPRALLDPRFGLFIDPRLKTLSYDPFVWRDADNDGVLTWAEMSNLLPQERSRADEGQNGPSRLLALDPTPDGRLTLDDARTIADAAFARIDKDGDGALSLAEIQPLIAIQQAPRREPTQKCDATAATEQQDVVRIGAGRGVLGSSVSVGKSSNGAKAVRVRIEPGDRRLYLVVSANESVVWLIEGAADRVDRIVASGNEPQGVAGVGADKVSFVAENCLRSAYEFDSVDGLIAKGETTSLVKRNVIAAGGARVLELISVPGMTIAPPRSSQSEETEVVQIDPSTVVAQGKVERYAFQPGKAGLDALARAGVLEKIDSRTYKLLKPLEGAIPNLARQGVRLVVAKNVLPPDIGAERICIVREETGEILSRREFCR